MEQPLPPSEPDKQTQIAILKRHVDPSGPMFKYMQNRCDLILRRSFPWLQPTMAGALQMLPPEAYPDMPSSSLTTRFVASTQNKTRCPVYCTRFAPDSRRVLTGDSAGGLSVWGAVDFGYMQYLQVHNKGIRDISFTHNGNFVLAADESGAVKISSITLKPLQDIKAHELAVRSVSASPTDQMFVSGSDDNTLKVWDLATATAITLAGRRGHGGEVRCVDWHPSTSLIASCARDAMIKLWDTRQEPGTAMLATLSGHKQAVNKVCWNLNGTYLASCSRDLTVKVWDVRHTKREMASWQGHGRDVAAVAWHPIHLDLLASAGHDGSVIFWLLGQQDALAKVEGAHENQINGLAFHPVGHMMTTCAVDGVSKYWVRPRPGDPWRGAEQREQEQMADLIAKASSHLQLPGLTIPGVAAGGGGGAGAGAGAATLPGGISVQQPGQQGQQHPGQVSPAAAGNMGPAPLSGRIPGLPMHRGPMPLPPGAPAVPGLAPGAPGLPVPPPGRPSGMMGMQMAGGGLVGGPGPMLRGQGPPAPPAAGAGGVAGRGLGRGMAGRGRGRGPMQSDSGGMKRPRGQFDMGYEAPARPAAGAAHTAHYPGPPKQQQLFHPQVQQHHVPPPQPQPLPPQQHGHVQHHAPQQQFQQQHHVAGLQQQRQQFGGQSQVLHQGTQGRGYGAPDAAGRGGFPQHPPGGRGDFAGRQGGRGYGRGFGRGRQQYQGH